MTFKCGLCKKEYDDIEAHGIALLNEDGEQISIIDVCDRCFQTSDNIKLTFPTPNDKPYLSDYVLVKQK